MRPVYLYRTEQDYTCRDESGLLDDEVDIGQSKTTHVEMSLVYLMTR